MVGGIEGLADGGAGGLGRVGESGADGGGGGGVEEERESGDAIRGSGMAEAHGEAVEVGIEFEGSVAAEEVAAEDGEGSEVGREKMREGFRFRVEKVNLTPLFLQREFEGVLVSIMIAAAFSL